MIIAELSLLSGLFDSGVLRDSIRVHNRMSNKSENKSSNGNLRVIRISFFVAVLAVLCFSGVLSAAPYAGDIVELEQPDGTAVQVRFWGDEYYCRGESLDGYTVVRDPASGWIVYAELNEDASEFIPTEVVYDHLQPTDPNHPGFGVRHPERAMGAAVPGKGHAKGLQKQLRERQDSVDAKHLRRRMELHPEQFMPAAGDALEDGYAAAPEISPAALTGSVVGLTILVEFPDLRGTIPPAEIERFCNQTGYTGYGNNGSVRDYYYAVSNGLLDYTNVVTDYVLLNKEKSYYDACGGWGKTGELIDEALGKLCAQGFNFSSLTKGSNGRVLALNILYAGSPNCGWSEGLWPHMSSRNVTFCGTMFGAYQMTNIGSSLRLGTFCHENGHMICGYPDLYDYTSSSNGVGSFCLMSYSGPGENPVPPCTYLRWTTGWETITNITNDPSGTVRTHTANTNTSFRYSHPTNSKEYFLIESRLKTGRNSGLPAEGLLIWRINEDGDNAYPTNHPTHPYRKFFRVALEQADGQFHLERRSGYGDTNDSFRSGYRDTFDDFTSPDAKWWDESFSGFSISNVGPVGGQMSFTVGAGFRPTAHYSFEGNLSDISGSGYHASGYNFPGNSSQWLSSSFTDSFSNLGGALHFDGVDDYLEIPAAVGATDEIGIAFWMKPDHAADMIPLDKHPNDATGAGWSVRLKSDGSLAFRVGSFLNAVVVSTRGPVYEAGRWTHVACSYKGGTVRIFINGQLRAMQNGLTVTSNTSALKVRMGIAAQVRPEWVYQGALDDVRFYTKELTEGRLQAVDGLNFKPGKGEILHLPLDERFAAIAEDWSQYEKHGVLKNGQTFAANSVDGVVGKALQFDGTDDYIEVPGGFDKMHDGFSVSLWAYPSAVKSWARFMDFGNGSSASNILLARYSTTNDLVFQVYNGSSSGNQVRATNAISLNVWQHFTATVTAGGAVVLYKNGQVVASGTTGSGLNVYRLNNYIGRSNWSNDAYYQGRMDEIRLYNYALSATEVQAVYRNRRIDGPYPVNGDKSVNPNVVLKWGFPDGTARHDIYFGTRYSSVVSATPESPEYRGRRQEALYKPAGLDPWCEYFWRVDALLTDGSVVSGPVWTFSTVGGVIRQVWMDISGDPVTNLTSNAAYPDKPSLTELIKNFEGPIDWSDTYGTRMIGQVWPTVSGLHTFWIASDDYSELWISSTPSASNAIKSASVSGYTDSRQWEKFTSQKTGQISMIAGNRYYIMALHKEGGGGDHVAVAWQGPSCPVREVIDGFWLRPVPENEWPVFNAKPFPTISASEGKPLNYSIAGSATDPDGTSLTYRKKSGPAWLNVSPNGQLSGTPRDGDAGLNSFVIQATDDKDGADESMLSIDVGDLYSGSKGYDDMLSFAGQWLSHEPENPADLTGNGRTDYADWNLFVQNWQRDIDEGLAAHWKMDDTEGLTVRDHYGRYDGVMANMSELARTKGYLGNALIFDGVDDYVEIPGYTGVAGGSSRTCSAWIKTTQASTAYILNWGHISNTGAKWLIRLDDDGTLRVAINNGFIRGVTNLADGAWHHIAVVLSDDGSPDVSEVRLYADGQPEIIGAVQPRTVNTSSDQTVKIGVDNNTGTVFFQGMIDDVRIYNRALDAQDIARQASLTPIAHWRFNEHSGGEVRDAASGHHGILVNMDAASRVQGTEGYALKFDGIDDYVEIPGFKGITGQASRTCVAWVKTTDVTKDFLSWGEDSTGGRWVVRINDNGELRAQVLGGYIIGTTKINDGAWHHIAVVLENDGSPQISNARLYVDGRRETRTTSSNCAVNTGSLDDVRIGLFSVSQRYFRGQIDDVRIYDRALSDDEISAMLY